MPRQIAFSMPEGWLVFAQEEMEQILSAYPDILGIAIQRGKSLNMANGTGGKRREKATTSTFLLPEMRQSDNTDAK